MYSNKGRHNSVPNCDQEDTIKYIVDDGLGVARNGYRTVGGFNSVALEDEARSSLTSKSNPYELKKINSSQ